jgi:class I fructose-bisphosphate aldolase
VKGLNEAKLLTNMRCILLAYDAGLEHGPADFNLTSIDPAFIVQLAERAKVNGLVLHHGIAEKYFPKKEEKKVPLIIKLNGKTNLRGGEPASFEVCSVDRALRLGADALGFTLYPGSEYEPVQFQQFGAIVEKAHRLGVPVIAWVYPRGAGVEPNSTPTIAHAARIALELGADFCKIHYNNDFDGFKWAVKAAGSCRVLVVGGEKQEDLPFLKYVREVMDAGATGIAVGRNVWQHEKPEKMLAAIKEVVYRNKSPEEALRKLL